MRNLWVGAVMSLALACPTAYAVQEMMPEEGAQAQEMAQPAKHHGGTHHKKHMHKKRAKKHHHDHKHKHHAKKHHAVPEGHETPAEQKIDDETDRANSYR